MTPPLVTCPTCGAAVRWVAESQWKPFCSERCKLIDLGHWATEQYRMPAQTHPDEATLPDNETAPDATGRPQ